MACFQSSSHSHLATFYLVLRRRVISEPLSKELPRKAVQAMGASHPGGKQGRHVRVNQLRAGHDTGGQNNIYMSTHVHVHISACEHKCIMSYRQKGKGQCLLTHTLNTQGLKMLYEVGLQITSYTFLNLWPAIKHLEVSRFCVPLGKELSYLLLRNQPRVFVGF